MGKQIYFRYKDSKLYEDFDSYYEFIKSLPLSIDEIEELDEYGYNIMHYCAFKSNIDPIILEYILSVKPNMYILSGNESLTAFELSLTKNSSKKMKIFIDYGYNHGKTDELGFTMQDKLQSLVGKNPHFYKEVNDEYKLGFNIDKVEVIKPSVSMSTVVLPTKVDIDVLALRLRIELENKLFDLIKTRIGSDLEDLIANKSLHELILNSFSLRLISYEQKEMFFKAKQIMNHYCHYQSNIDNRVEWFNMLSNTEKEDYLCNIKGEISKI